MANRRAHGMMDEQQEAKVVAQEAYIKHRPSLLARRTMEGYGRRSLALGAAAVLGLFS